MNKSNETTARPHSRRFVYEPCAFLLQFSERGVNVRNLDCDMVNSGPAFSEKLADSRIGSEGLEQLDVSVTHGKHAYLYALFGDFLGRVDFQPEHIAPHGQTLFDAVSGYSDVINFSQPE
jgi:hypothetical protein